MEFGGPKGLHTEQTPKGAVEFTEMMLEGFSEPDWDEGRPTGLAYH